MCGIAGQFVFRAGSRSIELAETTARMAGRLAYRGPDDMGLWQDDAAGICLVHRRLSILDLSPEGHQPMISADGRFVIVFNGEVYNHAALRREIEGAEAALGGQGVKGGWRGHSDTEAMLAAISRWGVLEATKRFVGMFAFALWDRAERALYLVRDRLGEKPLYYGWVDGVFLFASELKAFRVHPAWQGTLDRDALALYLQFNYIPAPFTIFEGIQKLEPGCIAKIGTAGKADVQKYWDLRDVAAAPRSIISEQSALAQTEQILSQSIGQQMVADVPIGAFLSGGIDSSLIVALMQKQCSSPVRTFTIGFHEATFNEANYAAAVARHLGTAHTEFYVTPQDALDVISLLPSLYDEPFADSSQIPTYLVAKLTRQHVKVSLSGDGGDELFGGYNRYSWGRNIWDRVKGLPMPMRKAASQVLCAPSPQTWDRLFATFGRVLPLLMRYNAPGDKLHKLGKLVGAKSASEVYLDLISLWNGADLVPGSNPRRSAATDPSQWPAHLDFTEFMMYLDAKSYLPDDILVKVDRATMGVGLESRAPFLDHRLAEFAWSLPLDLKIRKGQGKWLLRQILYQYVPRQLIERPKMGFGVPIDRWLRGPLREWAEALLDESRLRKEGYLNPAPIRQKWAEHLSGQRNWQHHLWGVLMFQAWGEQWL